MIKKLVYSISLIAGLILLSLNTMAQDLLKQADEQYNLFNYSKAVVLYEKLYKKEPSLYLAEHLANSYRLMQDYAKTELWYASAVTFPDSKPDNVLMFAQALVNNSKYAEAKVQFTKYYTLRLDVDKVKLKFYLASCDSALKWMKNPSPVNIKNELVLNSAKSDWGASAYNNSIVFTSDRPNKTTRENIRTDKPFLRFDGTRAPDKTVYGWTGNSYLRLYQVTHNNQAGDTVKLFPFIGQTEYHTGAVSFTADGSEAWFTITRTPKSWAGDREKIKTIRLEVFSVKKDPATHQWRKPVPFKYNNVKKYSVGDPFVTPDGKNLYFVSDMPGGLGGTDIYQCVKDDYGNWSQAVNLKSINTTGNERTPVTDSVNNLYFSSDGGVGMGGLDVYKAVRKGDTFGPKQNMAFPINSPQDDFAFMVNGSTTGYFSSNRQGGMGSDDIYSFTQIPVVTYKLEGIVYDKKTHEVIPGTTVILTKTNGTEARGLTTNAGKFSFILAEKTDYKLRGEKSGYLSDNQTLTTTGANPGQVIKRDLYIDKIVLNKAIKIENIYYDYDKSNIRPDAAVELDKLIKILKENPTIQIELGSHTDSRGNDDYNMALSQRRANAAVAYIIQIGGIDEDRITARGYGESRLLNRCSNGVKCSDAEHQLNRRTEFTIIKM